MKRQIDFFNVVELQWQCRMQFYVLPTCMLG